MCNFTLVLSVHQLKEDPCFLKALTTYLFDEISHLILFFKSKDKRPTTKEEKKEQKRKLKNPNPEECSVGVFDPRSCKKAAHAKLNIFLETSGNSKQTTINGEVSFVDLFLWLPILLRCNFLISTSSRNKVRTGHGKPEKSWNLRILFSRPRKS